MMSEIYLIGYIFAGLLTAIATMRVFPPTAGFRPRLTLRILAYVVFITLWPVLVSLAIWYFAMGYVGRSSEETSSNRTVDLVGTEPLTTWQGPKPR